MPVQIQRADSGKISLANRLVELELVPDESGVYRHRLYALNDTERQLCWESTELAPNNDQTISHPFCTEIEVIHESPEVVRVELHGEQGSHRFRVTITLNDESPWICFEVEDTITRLAYVEAVECFYTFARQETDFCYVPQLRPRDDQVIGMHVFRSPAVILQSGDLCGALVPDLDLLSTQQDLAIHQPGSNFQQLGRLPNCLDFEGDPEISPNPRVGYGFKGAKPVEHVYYRHTPDMAIEMEPRIQAYGFYLYAAAKAPARTGYREVVRFLWERYAVPYTRSALPQVVDFDVYADYGYGYALDRLWTQMEIDGKPCGYVAMGRELPGDVQFQAWFNHMRTALGLVLNGQRWEDASMREKGRRIKNLLLSAPQSAYADTAEDSPPLAGFKPEGNIATTGQSHGTTSISTNLSGNALQPIQRGERGDDQTIFAGPFPTVFYSILKNAIRHYAWRGSTRQGGGDQFWHTTDMSWAAYWLLRYNIEVEQDPRILPFCNHYARWLIEQVQLPNGAIPSWIRISDGYAMETLKESAQTAVSALFLAELFRQSRNIEHLKAATLAAEWLQHAVIPQHKWFDFEVFFSCSWKPLDFYDKHTRQWAQNNLVIHWAAELWKTLYIITGDPQHLEQGTALLDYLSLFQQIWDPPYLSIYGFGGFGVQNSDAEWNDARQGVFATTYLDYYQLTGRLEYLQRGIYAARACFTVMSMPENESISPKTYNQYATGNSGENYGHTGYDTPAGASGFDWQVGSGLVATAFLLRDYGDLYINLDRGHAVGVNGCVVTDWKYSADLAQQKATIDITLDDQIERDRPLAIVIAGMAALDAEVTINGRRALDLTSRRNPPDMEAASRAEALIVRRLERGIFEQRKDERLIMRLSDAIAKDGRSWIKE